MELRLPRELCPKADRCSSLGVHPAMLGNWIQQQPWAPIASPGAGMHLIHAGSSEAQSTPRSQIFRLPTCPVLLVSKKWSKSQPQT